MTADEVEKRLIRNYSDLADKTVYVQENSSHADHLRSLSEETGTPITLVEVPFESEELIQLVKNGEIDLAVCDEDVALVNSTYYPDIDVKTPLSSVQNLAWGIRRNHSKCF